MAKQISAQEVFEYIERRPVDANKGTVGRLLSVCGSRSYRGAASLSALGALRSGVGLLCVASTECVLASVSAKLNECIFLPLEETEEGSVSAVSGFSLMEQSQKYDACLLGCGLSQTEDVKKIVYSMITHARCRLILDADALNVISEETDILNQAKRPPILTPHVGEMARLIGRDAAYVSENRFDVAADFASAHNCIVVLKDYKTVTASYDGSIYENTTGNAGLARGGSGDVLAGIIASFSAQKIPPLYAAVCGVYLHGAAADRCAARLSQHGMLPSDLLEDLCAIFREYQR